MRGESNDNTLVHGNGWESKETQAGSYFCEEDPSGKVTMSHPSKTVWQIATHSTS